MKRILWTMTAVAALTVPAGVGLAQSDDDVTEPDTPPTAVCEHEQLREQRRLHDGTGDQERAQQRLQEHECDEHVREQMPPGPGQRDMARDRAADCDGRPARDQERATHGPGSR